MACKPCTSQLHGQLKLYIDLEKCDYQSNERKDDERTDTVRRKLPASGYKTVCSTYPASEVRNSLIHF